MLKPRVSLPVARKGLGKRGGGEGEANAGVDVRKCGFLCLQCCVYGLTAEAGIRAQTGLTRSDPGRLFLRERRTEDALVTEGVFLALENSFCTSHLRSKL